jgi:hypothetical protein
LKLIILDKNLTNLFVSNPLSSMENLKSDLKKLKYKFTQRSANKILKSAKENPIANSF